MAKDKSLPVTVVNREDNTVNEEETKRINQANKKTREGSGGGTYGKYIDKKEREEIGRTTLLTNPPQHEVYYDDGTTEIVPIAGAKSSFSPEDLKKFREAFRKNNNKTDKKSGGMTKKYGYMGGGKVYGQPRKANYKAG